MDTKELLSPKAILSLENPNWLDGLRFEYLSCPDHSLEYKLLHKKFCVASLAAAPLAIGMPRESEPF